MTVEQLFKESWDAEVAKRVEQSPSYSPEDYTATGRAKAEYGGKRSTAWWLDHGPGMVQSWIDWKTEHGWTIWDVAGQPAIELSCNFTLPGLDLPIVAYIDRVYVLPTGELAVLDLKTGRTPETAEQLGLYATAIQAVHGVRPKWGYWWSPDKGHVGPFDLDHFTPEFFSLLFNEATVGINAGVFIPNPNNACKNWCGVAQFCHIVGGELASGHDPLAPVLTIATKERTP